MNNNELHIVLDNVRYNNNVGPIFRVAEAYNVSKIHICRGNRDQFSDQQMRILRKNSRGAIDYVDWELTNNSYETVKNLKDRGINIISIDIRAKQNIASLNFKLAYPIALVFGHEGHGVDPEIIQISDELIKIPMFGQGTSLNVASSVAIIVYKIRELTDI